MLVTEDSIPWLAGVIEGEGYIGSRESRTKRDSKTYRYVQPRVVLSMTDPDIIERVAKLLGVAPRVQETQRAGKKLLYGATVAGKPALGLLLKLFPYLGERRRSKISETLSQWEHN